MSFGKIGRGYFLIDGEKIPVFVTEIHSSICQEVEFRGHFCGLEYASGGIIPVEKSPIKNVIFNDPATVVIWDDGSKTVVKCQPGDTYSKETGLALCIAKKYLGNKGNFNEVFKKWIPEEVEPVEETEPVAEVRFSFEEDAETGEISVGDTVRVVNCGEHYPSYKGWILDHVTDPDDQRKWLRNTRSWGDGSIGLVKYLAPHADCRDVLAYVDFGDSCSIISVDGLEKVEEG